MATDMTEQMRALTELRLNQERFELAQAAAGISSWEWDFVTNEVHTSPENGPLYGLPRGANLTYDQWLNLIHPEDRERIAGEFARALAELDEYLWEFRVVWPDGSVHWILSKGRVHRSKEGKPIRAFGINMDNNDRKVAEHAIRESEQRFRSMADAAPVMLCASGPDGNATFFNRGWLQFTGRTMEQALGTGWLADVHPEERKAALAEINAAFEARRYCQAEYRLRHADGEYRWILCHGTPRYEHDGEFTGYVASAIDITDLKRAHEAELARQKMASVGMVAAGVAHDLKNLLSSVIAEAELLQSDLPRGSPAREGIARVNLVAGRAAEIASELLDYAASDTTVLKPLDLSRLVREMIELLRVSVSKSATLDVLLPARLPLVRGNASQLRQVLLNLVTNASEALQARKGNITVNTALVRVTPLTSAEFEPNLAEGDYVRLEVSDTGGGMSDYIRARIFDPFFTTKVEGRGLGLAVVQGIVRSHGGGIRVSSRPGGGTQFLVLLPALTAPVPEPPKTPPETGLETVPKHGTLLVVDDEISLVAPIAAMLQRQGFTVLQAAEGRTAIEIFAAHASEIRVVLLDLVMPGMSGIEVLNELRRIQPDIRVIVTTAYTQEQLHGELGGNGVWAFLRKPYHFDDLVELVRRALEE